MQYTTLGHSGIEVSRVCLGGMSFGAPSVDFHQWTIGPEETLAVIKRALDLGVSFIDTANCYAHGTSEEYIGAALRGLGVPRDKVVLASKVFFNDGGLSRGAIRREIDGTLERLGTDYLDLYIIHRFDYDTPIEETMEALDGLVRAGKVRAIGASAMYAYQLHNMQVTAEQNGWTKFTSMQCHYNLLYREDEREMIPVCRQYGMALTPTASATCPSWNGSRRLRRTTAFLWRRWRLPGIGRAGSRRRLSAAPNRSESTRPWRHSTSSSRRRRPTTSRSPIWHMSWWGLRHAPARSRWRVRRTPIPRSRGFAGQDNLAGAREGVLGKEIEMAVKQTAGRDQLGGLAPKFAQRGVEP